MSGYSDWIFLKFTIIVKLCYGKMFDFQLLKVKHFATTKSHYSDWIVLKCTNMCKIHTHSKEGHQKFLGGETKYEAKLVLPGRRWCAKQKPSVGVSWIFSGTAQSINRQTRQTTCVENIPSVKTISFETNTDSARMLVPSTQGHCLMGFAIAHQ